MNRVSMQQTYDKKRKGTTPITLMTQVNLVYKPNNSNKPDNTHKQLYYIY